jgi:hypothetical protein
MNFENPTPVPSHEQEPNVPSLEEITAQLREIIGHDHYRELPTQRSDANGILLFEVVVTESNGDETLYAYRRADGNIRSSTTQVTATYFTGPIDAGVVTGAENLSDYDPKTRTWKQLPKNPVVEQAPQQATSVQQKIKEQPVVSPETNELAYQALLQKFFEAEATFGTTSLEETLRREEENMELALEKRSEARPLLNAIYTELKGLNDDDLTIWHASGHLTEAQFDELNLRRKKLANLLGALNGGKIRHDVATP